LRVTAGLTADGEPSLLPLSLHSAGRDEVLPARGCLAGPLRADGLSLPVDGRPHRDEVLSASGGLSVTPRAGQVLTAGHCLGIGLSRLGIGIGRPAHCVVSASASAR